MVLTGIAIAPEAIRPVLQAPPILRLKEHTAQPTAHKAGMILAGNGASNFWVAIVM